MAATRRMGYAVVGLGRFAEWAVLPAFRRSRKAKLVALVSGDERKAKRLAAKFGASDYHTYEDFALCLGHPQVDAVYIVTNNSTHAEYSKRAAAAGKHVLCEKPMATTVEECRVMIAYRKYFEPASRELKKLVSSGKLGRLRIIHSAFTILLPPGKKVPAWQLDHKRAGGGALVDVGVYCVNTVR